MKVQKQIEELTIHIYESRIKMGLDAAAMAGERIKTLLAEKAFINVIFAAAPSQNEFIAALIACKEIDWMRINAFHMDEYIGLPTDAPQRFGNFLSERLFTKVPFQSVHYINGNAALAEEECKRYAALLQKFSPDIVCMGIGENGHIAFNDPPVANFNDPLAVKVVQLDEPCRIQQVNDGCFVTLADVPTHAITLTIPTLMQGKHIYCMVPGKTKSKAIFNTLYKEMEEAYPATILRKHTSAILYLDDQSSSLL